MNGIDVASEARRLYADGPLLARKLQQWRPHIAPFDQLIALVPEGASVLDIGCGAGLFLGLLAVTGRLKSGVGFDSNPEAIALAGRMRSGLPCELQAKLRFERLDTGAEWPDGTFDVVSLIDLLHHIRREDQEAVFRKAMRTVSPGGLVVYKDMAMQPVACATANQLHDLVLARQWIHHVPMRLVMAWAAQEGATVRTKGRARLFWYAHEWALFRRLRDPSPADRF